MCGYRKEHTSKRLFDPIHFCARASAKILMFVPRRAVCFYRDQAVNTVVDAFSRHSCSRRQQRRHCDCAYYIHMLLMNSNTCSIEAALFWTPYQSRPCTTFVHVRHGSWCRPVDDGNPRSYLINIKSGISQPI